MGRQLLSALVLHCLLSGAPAFADPVSVEDMLASTVESLQRGEPHYALMTPSLAEAIRPQAEHLEALLGPLGGATAFQQVAELENGFRFLSEHTDSMLRWDVHLGPDGKLTGLWFWRIASERDLSRHITGLLAGTPDYASMMPPMADAIRSQAETLRQSLTRYGAVSELRGQGLTDGGMRYIARHANGMATRWDIYLASDGRLNGLWYWNLAPGMELRRQIDGLIAGKPDYAAMTASMAKAIEPKVPALQRSLAALGSPLSVQAEDETSFLVHHANGSARWTLNRDDNFKVTGLWYRTLPKVERPPVIAQTEPADGGGFFGFLGKALEVAAVVSDTSGKSYNNYIARNVPALRPLAEAANNYSQSTLASTGPSARMAQGGPGAVTPGSYPTRPNTLLGQPACAGYTNENFESRFAANQHGPDVQLHTMCAAAFNYYAMYLNAIRKGYSESDSLITYGVFEDAAKTAVHFYNTAR